MDKTTKERTGSLLSYLREQGLDQHGSVIPGDALREIIGIAYPASGTKAEFDAIELRELAAVDHLRNQLLDEGKYLARVRANYRILLPSENRGQINSYMTVAMNKIRRGQRLYKNTRAEHFGVADTTEARMMMTLNSIKTRAVFGEPQ